MQHFLSIADLSTEQILAIFDRAIRLRSDPAPVLSGKTLCCLFGKASLRTRVSFEQAMRLLGGTAMTLTDSEIGVGSRESPEDVARVLARMVDGLVARVVSHDTLVRLAAPNALPVINGLSDIAHPAQALADILTMADEFSPGNVPGLAGRTLAFVGDGNNVARSLGVICAKLGMRFRICSPPGYELTPDWIRRVAEAVPGASITACGDPVEAVLRADAIYCDTFVSMGQEHERTQRLNAFSRYQVNEPLVRQAPSHAIVLHCLPASRGVEITDEVMDGPRSRVFEQARNRVDAQVGLLAALLGG